MVGTDAVILHGLTGLKPQRNLPFVGFPARQIQSYLDAAVKERGFQVAVYEELPQRYLKSGKKKAKDRELMKIVAPEDPVYDYAGLTSDYINWSTTAERPTPALIASGITGDDLVCTLYLLFRGNREVHAHRGLSSDQVCDVMEQRCPEGSIMYVQQSSVEDRADGRTLPLAYFKDRFFEVKPLLGDDTIFLNKVKHDVSEYFELDVSKWPFAVVEQNHFAHEGKSA